MVPGIRPVIRLEKLPVPLPLFVLVLNAILGSEEVLQITPRVVTGEAPCSVTFPPKVTENVVISPFVVKVTSFPTVVLTVGSVSAERNPSCLPGVS